MKSKKKKPSSHKCIVCAVVIIVVIIIGGMIFLNRKNSSIMAQFSWPQLCYNGSCLYVQVPSNTSQSTQGLMYRRSLDENKGLLLDFKQPGICGATMRNIEMPLDMIWLDENYTILYIKTMALPCTEDPCPTFSSPIPAQYVLEISGGLTEKIGLREGNVFTLKK